MPKLLSKKQSEKTPIKIGSRVTFIGNLPGGDYDNYYGYTKRGAIYATVVATKRVNCIVETKIGDQYEIRIDELTNIEDLF